VGSSLEIAKETETNRVITMETDCSSDPTSGVATRNLMRDQIQHLILRKMISRRLSLLPNRFIARRNYAKTARGTTSSFRASQGTTLVATLGRYGPWRVVSTTSLIFRNLASLITNPSLRIALLISKETSTKSTQQALDTSYTDTSSV